MTGVIPEVARVDDRRPGMHRRPGPSTHFRPTPGLARVLLATVLTCAPAAAQTGEGSWIAAGVTVNLFVGSSSDFLDSGIGGDATLSIGVTRHVSVRADGMLIRLTDERNLGEVAGNTILVLGLGPEAHVSLSALTLYARPLVGAATNRQRRTSSSLAERVSWATVVGGGVGARVRLVPGVAVDLGGDIVRLGELDFARTEVSSRDVRESTTILRLRAGFSIALR